MMYRIDGIELSADRDYAISDLKQSAALLIGVKVCDFTERFEIVKKSLDARRKSNIRWIFSVIVEIREGATIPIATRATPLRDDDTTSNIPLQRLLTAPDTAEAQLPFCTISSVLKPQACQRPIVVGAGPAGLFAALTLADAGLAPIVLERGRPIDERVRDIEAFWQGGALSPDSNVQFGEGGAGTFSDGKLTTGIRDPRIRSVLETFVRSGAPNEILYLQKPHIGTDRLRGVVKNLRIMIEGMGGEFRFSSKLVGVIADNNLLKAAEIEHNGAKYELPCSNLVLATGHSARDTFYMLLSSGVSIEPKPFAVGLRIEHAQSVIDFAQYGRERGDFLPPADYKLSYKTRQNLDVYTFCMCPGGRVVAAASEEGGVVTNGMSLHARAEANANSAVLVGVSPNVFGHGPLDGVAFQRELERAAFKAAGSSYRAPAQYSSDFLKNKGRRDTQPTYLPGVVETTMDAVLPRFVTDALREALPMFDRKLHGFADGLLTGVESRSSSPVRIRRDERRNSSVLGLIPCGEGAGYAGGIVSAAVDGIRCAEAVLATAQLRRVSPASSKQARG